VIPGDRYRVGLTKGTRFKLYYFSKDTLLVCTKDVPAGIDSYRLIRDVQVIFYTLGASIHHERLIVSSKSSDPRVTLVLLTGRNCK
jgi:hypothetical protein